MGIFILQQKCKWLIWCLYFPNSLVTTNDKKILQSWTKGCRQIDETKQNRYFYGIFYSRLFVRFYQKHHNLAFRWSAEYLPSNPSISEIFLQFVHLHIHFLVIKSSSVLLVVKRNCAKTWNWMIEKIKNAFAQKYWHRQVILWKPRRANRICFIKSKFIVWNRNLYTKNGSLFHEIEIYFIQSKFIY